MCFLTNLLLPRTSSAPPLILLLIKKVVPLRMVRQTMVKYILQAYPDEGTQVMHTRFRFVFRLVGAFPSDL